MIGIINCVYETPCGWCSKWDKKCDEKIPERGQRAKCNPVDDAISFEEALVNKMCVKESDHEWESFGITAKESLWACSKCGAHKSIPINPV